MSTEKKRLEHNKEMVDDFLLIKQYTYAEMVMANGGLEFLQYMIDEGISVDFSNALFIKSRISFDNYEIFPMIYMLNILSGDWPVRRTQKILRNESTLRLLGFSDEIIANGLTQRGKKNQYGKGFERKSGIMASTTLIDNLACFDLQGIIECFNKYIKRKSDDGSIDFGDIFILDSTIVETDVNYPGAKPVRRNNEEGDETDELVWGFKVFILSSAKMLTPIAIHITTANDADSPMFLEMIKLGVANLGEGKIKIVLADRGFIDGQQMYRLKYDMNIDFIIPAKKNMDIWKCMTGLRNDNKDNIEEWKNRKKGLAGGYLSKGSVSYSQYAAEPAGNNKNKNGAPINAVVVTRWAGNEISPGKEKVILTSLNTKSATKIISLYGQRSLIENCNFRELKQAAALNDLPQYANKNAEATAKIHMVLCVFTLTVFNMLVETVYINPECANERIPKNIREFRFMKECEKPKIFILARHYYHIYGMDEFMVFAGFSPTPRE
jgi:hypothetical protein